MKTLKTKFLNIRYKIIIFQWSPCNDFIQSKRKTETKVGKT